MPDEINMDPNSDGSIILGIFNDLPARDILLILQSERRNPMWKMPGETIEIGEPIPSAIIRGAKEEARLEIPFDHATGKVLDPRYKILKLSQRLRTNRERLSHIQYFYAIIVPEAFFRPLGGKIWREENAEAELIETKIFPLSTLEDLPDFLYSQRNLIQSLKTAA